MFFLFILKLEKSPPSTEKMVDVRRKKNCSGNESPMNLLFDTVMHEVIPITTFLIFCNIVEGGELIW